MVRVLIEAGNALTRLDLTEALEARGFDVVACTAGGRECPLTTGGTCQYLDGADVVVNALAEGQTEVYLAQREHDRSQAVLLLTDCLREGDLAVFPDDRNVRTGPSTAGGEQLAVLIAGLLEETHP